MYIHIYPYISTYLHIYPYISMYIHVSPCDLITQCQFQVSIQEISISTLEASKPDCLVSCCESFSRRLFGFLLIIANFMYID